MITGQTLLMLEFTRTDNKLMIYQKFNLAKPVVDKEHYIVLYYPLSVQESRWKEFIESALSVHTSYRAWRESQISVRRNYRSWQ